MNRLSVIIPSYNSVRTLDHTLKALFSADEGLLQEIIVVDSSDDGKTPLFLSAYKVERLVVVSLEKKTMPAVARNIGAERARGQILAFVDADAYPAPDWLKKISDAVDSGCLVGGGSVAMPSFQETHLIALAQFFLQFNEFMAAGLKRKVTFVTSCNMFCEKSFFKKVGGFPEIRASEDVLFGFSANRLSAVYFIPELLVYHIFREELAAYLKNQILLGRYIIPYRRRVMKDKFYYKKLWPLFFLPAFMLIKLSRITLRVIKNGARSSFKYLLALPLVLLGLFFWGMGFTQGCFENERPMNP